MAAYILPTVRSEAEGMRREGRRDAFVSIEIADLKASALISGRAQLWDALITHKLLTTERQEPVKELNI